MGSKLTLDEMVVTMGRHQPKVAVLVPDKKLDRFVQRQFLPQYPKQSSL